jgi:hypothetical protein
MQRRKGETHISGFRGLGLREFQCPNLNINKFTKCDQTQTIPEIAKRNGELTFWNFGIQGFGFSNTKRQYTTTSKFQKVKGSGTNTSGFRDSGFRGFKYQTTIHNNSRISKG